MSATDRLHRQLVAGNWFFRYHGCLGVVLTGLGFVLQEWVFLLWGPIMAMLSLSWVVWYRRYQQRRAAFRQEREALDREWAALRERCIAEEWSNT